MCHACARGFACECGPVMNDQMWAKMCTHVCRFYSWMLSTFAFRQLAGPGKKAGLGCHCGRRLFSLAHDCSGGVYFLAREAIFLNCVAQGWGWAGMRCACACQRLHSKLTLKLGQTCRVPPSKAEPSLGPVLRSFQSTIHNF